MRVRWFEGLLIWVTIAGSALVGLAIVLIRSRDLDAAPKALRHEEWSEISAGRSVTLFDGAATNRAWPITAPLLVNGQVIGSLKGRFSLWKYVRSHHQADRLGRSGAE